MATEQLRTQLAQRAANGNGNGLTINSLLAQEAVKKRFEEVLGAKAAGFMSSVINVTKSNNMLLEADPRTILASAAVAASLDLPIDPNLGFAYIIPYRNRGKVEAQFQMGYRGYIQLAMRTGQYRLLNATEVYKGEIKSRNRLTGEIEFDEEARESDEVIGYAAYFRLLNGFEKTLYMTVDEVTAHAKRFSKSFGKESSPWTTDFHAMALKTVLKRLISKYGILSVQMQTAVLADQAVVREGENGYEYDYADGADVIDVEPSTVGEDEPDPEEVAAE